MRGPDPAPHSGPGAFRWGLAAALLAAGLLIGGTLGHLTRPRSPGRLPAPDPSPAGTQRPLDLLEATGPWDDPVTHTYAPREADGILEAALRALGEAQLKETTPVLDPIDMEPGILGATADDLPFAHAPGARALYFCQLPHRASREAWIRITGLSRATLQKIRAHLNRDADPLTPSGDGFTLPRDRVQVGPNFIELSALGSEPLPPVLRVELVTQKDTLSLREMLDLIKSQSRQEPPLPPELAREIQRAGEKKDLKAGPEAMLNRHEEELDLKARWGDQPALYLHLAQIYYRDAEATGVAGVFSQIGGLNAQSLTHALVASHHLSRFLRSYPFHPRGWEVAMRLGGYFNATDGLAAAAREAILISPRSWDLWWVWISRVRQGGVRPLQALPAPLRAQLLLGQKVLLAFSPTQKIRKLTAADLKALGWSPGKRIRASGASPGAGSP